MTAPDVVQQLVECFEQQYDIYRSVRYTDPADRARHVYGLYGLSEDEIRIVEGG